MYRLRHFLGAPKLKFKLFIKVKVSDIANIPEQMLLLSRVCKENRSSPVVLINLEDILWKLLKGGIVGIVALLHDSEIEPDTGPLQSLQLFSNLDIQGLLVRTHGLMRV
jgi:hypothetical protein